jgi:glycerol-3-phosphate acyltransferase PlsY
MTFVGGGIALSPLAGALALGLCAVVSAARSFAWGARAGVFAFPVIQLAVDPVERVAATGALMCLIGALFGIADLRRRSARATPASDGAPRA